MILTGMEPVGHINTEGSKLFSAIYCIVQRDINSLPLSQYLSHLFIIGSCINSIGILKMTHSPE
jgi:hypothetical protein